MPEVRSLIVNADDFGLHPSVNHAILRAHREGIVTSTTALIGGAAFSEAVEELKETPRLGVGIHLCLVGESPVSDPEKIQSLLDSENRLHHSYSVFIRQFLLGRIRLKEVQIELEAQVSRALDCGLQPTHLDSHQHLHLLPGISRIVADIGLKFGIRRIRIPAEDTESATKSLALARRIQAFVVRGLAKPQGRMYEKKGLSSPQHFAGFSAGGNFDGTAWRRLIPNLQKGVTEVMVHPGEDNQILEKAVGYGYHWREELEALLDPEIRIMLERHQIQLIHYGQLS